MNVNIFGSISLQQSSINKKYVDSKFIALTKTLQTKVNKDGDIMEGNLDMNGNKIVNVGDPSDDLDVINKQYLEKRILEQENDIKEILYTKVSKSNDTMNGNLDMDNNRITNLSHPVNILDAVNRQFVEQSIAEAVYLRLNRNDLEQEVSKLQLYTLSTTGLVPNLSSNNDKTGYIVSASNEFGNNNCHKVFRLNGDWKVNASPTDEFWISIKCIKPVKIYMFSIKPSEKTSLIHWKIQGKNMIIDWQDLPFTLNPITNFAFAYFEINPKLAKEYIEYRILIQEAEHDNNTPGLSHWQLYTVNPVYI